MTPGKTTAAVIALLALPSGAGIAGAPAAAAAPLSPADYGVGALCSTPAPGHAACLGLALLARAPLSLPGARAVARPARAGGGSSTPPVPATEFQQPLAGLTPQHLRSAYGLAATPAPASTQTIGIVDAYDDPSAEADLATFDNQFGLPSCTEAEGCFRKVNQAGNAAPLPPWKGESSEKGWAEEIATDIETAHAVCSSCHILLVEASSSSYADLFAAEDAAAALGANEISNSWGGSEPLADSPAFNHPGVVITAASGDSGYLNWLREFGHYADYPASSPRVVAVGGTRLLQSAGTRESESVWNDGGEQEGRKTGAGASGGGCSGVFAAPLWQQSAPGWSGIGCAGRAVADVAADGDPYTGVDVYDSTATPTGNTGWMIIGGTSVSSPIIASVFALAGGAHGVEYPARTLYENAPSAAASLHDVSSGSNGECTHPFNGSTGTSGCTSAEEAASCSSRGICLAGSGYDGPSGVGTPNGIAAFQPPGTGNEGGGREEGGGLGGAGGGLAPGGSAGASSGGGLGQPGVSASQLPPSSSPSVRLASVSALALTRSALNALNGVRPRIPRVSFAFTLTAPARLTATLARWTRWHRRGRWRIAARPFTFAAAPGRTSAHLRGRGALLDGRYRLTVTPALGVPAAVSFQIG
jgi:hypothetical protein